jgi:hypothetical protein
MRNKSAADERSEAGWHTLDDRAFDGTFGDRNAFAMAGVFGAAR